MSYYSVHERRGVVDGMVGGKFLANTTNVCLTVCPDQQKEESSESLFRNLDPILMTIDLWNLFSSALAAASL